jgi:hypothetical protein
MVDAFQTTMGRINDGSPLRSFFADSINFGEDGRTRGRATRHHRTPAPTISTRTW